MIQAKLRTVYFSQAAGRHYQSLAAACHAQAHARIKQKYPTERGDETGGYWSLQFDEPEKYARMMRFLKRLYRRQFRAAQSQELI